MKPKFDRGTWRNPPTAYSQVPFWFWNDVLSEKEMVRQMDDFQAHGVDAFVIHPRIGLPASITWNSEELFHYMRFAVAEAARRGMWVLLYDEGMYPSGSSAGQVVASNPAFHVRGLICEREGSKTAASSERNLIAKVPSKSGQLYCIYDQPVDSVVRGLHYLGADPEAATQEEEHAAADLLNPDAVHRFIELVYERYYRELGAYFGSTIRGIFTDEPHPLGRIRTPNAMPGTTDILKHINGYLGYDFTPHLPSLWLNDEPDAGKYQKDYREAIAARLNTTYYSQLGEWCTKHGVALTGHPADPDDFGHLDYFQIPGQDIVWRHIEPFQPSALEGSPSTMAKAAASSAYHRGRERNLNEFAGAYGIELTSSELQWLASWLLIRGCNMLSPHAFYYSMRGQRGTERPPDVGPNSPWWSEYRAWAVSTKRLCWLNGGFKPICHVAILGRKTELPWKAAKVCFENQIDFHYLSVDDIPDSKIKEGVLYFREGRYAAILSEFDSHDGLPSGVPIFGPNFRIADLKRLAPSIIELESPQPGLRFRHLGNGDGVSVVLLFNEGRDAISTRINFQTPGTISKLSEIDGSEIPWTSGSLLSLASSEWAVFVIE